MTDSPIFSDHSINTEDLNFSVAIVHSQPTQTTVTYSISACTYVTHNFNSIRPVVPNFFKYEDYLVLTKFCIPHMPIIAPCALC